MGNSKGFQGGGPEKEKGLGEGIISNLKKYSRRKTRRRTKKVVIRYGRGTCI